MRVDLSEFSMEELIGLAVKAVGKTVLIKSEEPLSVVVFQNRIPVYARYRGVTGDEAFLSTLFINQGFADIVHLPLNLPVRTNILKPYEELMLAYEQRRPIFFEYYDLLPSLKVKLRITLDAINTVACLHRLEWQILVGASKGMTLEQTVNYLRTTDYYARLATVELITKGLASLVEEPTSMVAIASAEPASPYQENLPAQPEELAPKGVTALQDGFVLGVSILPFTDEFLEASDIDDFTLVLNPVLYEWMCKKQRVEFKKAWVSNPDNLNLDSVLCKVVCHDDVLTSAMTVAALFKLKVRDGTWVKVVPA